MDHIGSDNPAVTEITATVMVQTEAALKRMMESTQLTIGEVIDRLALQMMTRDKETAAVLCQRAGRYVFLSAAEGPVHGSIP